MKLTFQKNLVFLCCAFLICLQEQSIAQTRDDTNREVVLVYARMLKEGNHYPEAGRVLTDYLVKDARDPRLWEELGEIQIAEKRVTEACYAYQKARTLYGSQKRSAGFVRTSYRFANCLQLSGRSAEAKASLKETVAFEPGFTHSVSQALSQLQTGVIRNAEPLPSFAVLNPGAFHVSASVSSGYDSNVLFVDENAISETNPQDLGSFFITPAVQLDYFAKDSGDGFQARYSGAYTKYLNEKSENFNALFQRLDISFGRGPIRFGLFADALFLNRNPFQLYDFRAGGSYLNLATIEDHYLHTWEIVARFQKFALDLDQGDFSRTGGALAYRNLFRWTTDPSHWTSFQPGLEAQYTKGRNYRLVSVDLPFVYASELPLFSSFGFVNTFSIEAFAQYFIDAEPKRKDALGRVALGVIRPFLNDWTVGLDFAYLKNISSLEAARFHKFVSTLQVSHGF